MAVGIQNYPNINAPDGDYPNGSIKNKDGTSHGTPVNRLTANDMHQFFAKILREAEVEANGLPDSEYVGNQYYQALLMNCFNRVGAPIITSMIGSYTEDDLIVLYGVTVSVVSNTATWTEGYIFYNGNIYFVPAGSDTKGSGDTFFYTITSDMMFEIGISHGASGDGIADYGSGTVKLLSIINSGTWTNLTLLNSYTSGTSGTNPTVQYKKDINGIIYFRGQLKAPSSVSSNVFGSLPVGFAPTADSNFVVTGNSQVVIGAASRQLQIIDLSGSNVAGNTIHYISGILFPTI